jgi:hypothetical protein
MAVKSLDISSLLNREDCLPCPQWELIAQCVESSAEPEHHLEVWDDIVRQWLAQLARALGEDYRVDECEHFAIVGFDTAINDSLLRFAEHARGSLLILLPGVAAFDQPSKEVVVAFKNAGDYYRYVSLFTPEGEQGGSGGMHIRMGYPHVILQAIRHHEAWILQNTLAHELTHVSLLHLSMPPWIEEGLAQLVEHDLTRRGLLELTTEIADRHKTYWRKNGVDEFWRGDGFSRSGKVQELSYQLAEILLRLLFEEFRPRWFGWVREPQQKLMAFLREARADDCGEAACREHLGHGLTDLAAKFLGPGDWSPSL